MPPWRPTSWRIGRDVLAEPPAVVGASLGGVAALLAVGELGLAVRGLVLVDIVPRSERSGVRRVVIFLAGSQYGFASLEEAVEAVQAYKPDRPVDARAAAPEPACRGRRALAVALGSPARVASGPYSRDIPERMATASAGVKVPTLLVRGKRSDMVSDEGVAEFRALVPHAEYVDVAGAAHMVTGDHNDAFARAQSSRGFPGSERTLVDLELTDEQRLMVDTFAAFFAKESSVGAVRASDTTDGHDADLWARFCGLGGPLLSLPEPAGGGGGSLLDAALVGFEAGRRLAPIGYADAVVAARALGRASGAAWDELGVGDAAVAWAPAWAGAVTVDGGAVSGHLRWTRTGGAARWLVADTGSELALVDLEGAGVARATLPNLARFPMAEIHLDDAVPRRPLAPPRRRPADGHRRSPRCSPAPSSSAPVARRCHWPGITFSSGASSTGPSLPSRRSSTASPTGTPPSTPPSFSCCGPPQLRFGRGRLRFFSAVALLRAAEAGELAAKEALQFFGGYGFTLEYDVHLYLRFAKALAVLAQDPSLVDDALPARCTEGDDIGPPPLRRTGRARPRPKPSSTPTSQPRWWNGPGASGTLHDDTLHRAIAARGWIGAWWPPNPAGSAARRWKRAPSPRWPTTATPPSSPRCSRSSPPTPCSSTATDSSGRSSFPGCWPATC